MEVLEIARENEHPGARGQPVRPAVLRAAAAARDALGRMTTASSTSARSRRPSLPASGSGWAARSARYSRETRVGERGGGPLAELVHADGHLGVPLDRRLEGADRHLPRRVPRAARRDAARPRRAPARAALDGPERRLLRLAHAARQPRLEGDAAARRQGARRLHARHRVLRRRRRPQRDAAVVLLPDPGLHPRGHPPARHRHQRRARAAQRVLADRTARRSTPPHARASCPRTSAEHHGRHPPLPHRRARRRHLARARRLAALRPAGRRQPPRARPRGRAARSRRLAARGYFAPTRPTSSGPPCTVRAARTARCAACSSSSASRSSARARMPPGWPGTSPPRRPSSPAPASRLRARSRCPATRSASSAPTPCSTRSPTSCRCPSS